MFAKQTNLEFFITSRSSDTSIEYSICSADSSHKGLFAPQFSSWLFLCLLSVFPGEINLKTAQFFLLFICWFICLSYSLLFCGKQINRNAEQCCSRDRFKDGKVFPPHKSIKSWPQARRKLFNLPPSSGFKGSLSLPAGWLPERYLVVNQDPVLYIIESNIDGWLDLLCSPSAESSDKHF